MNGNVETYEIMSDGELYWLDKDTYDEVISHLSESIANQIKILVLSRSGGNVYVTNDFADFVEQFLEYSYLYYQYFYYYY